MCWVWHILFCRALVPRDADCDRRGCGSGGNHSDHLAVHFVCSKGRNVLLPHGSFRKAKTVRYRKVRFFCSNHLPFVNLQWNRNFWPKPEPEQKSFRFGSGSVIFTETGMGSHSSIHSKKALTARSKNLGISIIRYKNLQNRVISKILQKNMLLFFFKYIASSEILKIFTILFRCLVLVPVRFQFGKIHISH